MTHVLTRAARAGDRGRVRRPGGDRGTLGDVTVPDDIAAWLGRLLTLTGVPFGYLVRDEGMLPPESIRFFRLDERLDRGRCSTAPSAWAATLPRGRSASANLDRALFGLVAASARAAAPAAASSPAWPRLTSADAAWTGFLLRSRVVAAYPGLGVNVYPEGHTPDDAGPVLLPVRRLDRLGPDGDTLFCLVEGDAYRVDVHEAPGAAALRHRRLQSPRRRAAPTAVKELHKFRRRRTGRSRCRRRPSRSRSARASGPARRACASST